MRARCAWFHRNVMNGSAAAASIVPMVTSASMYRQGSWAEMNRPGDRSSQLTGYPRHGGSQQPNGWRENTRERRVPPYTGGGGALVHEAWQQQLDKDDPKRGYLLQGIMEGVHITNPMTWAVTSTWNVVSHQLPVTNVWSLGDGET